MKARIVTLVAALVVLALAVVVVFEGTLFGSDEVRTLSIPQERQHVKVTLKSLRYVSSPQSTSRVLAAFDLRDMYGDPEVSATVTQGQVQYNMVVSVPNNSESVPLSATIYFEHFDIDGSSKMQVTLTEEGFTRTYVFAIPAK
jgi:hypothetical protein